MSYPNPYNDHRVLGVGRIETACQECGCWDGNKRDDDCPGCVDCEHLSPEEIKALREEQ